MNHSFYHESNGEPSPVPNLFEAPVVPPPTSKRPAYRGLDMLLACLAFVMGYLFVCALPFTRNALGAMLVFWGMFALSAIYFLRSGVRISVGAWCIAACALVLSVGLISGGNNTVRFFLSLCLVGLFFCFNYAACGLHGNRVWGEPCFEHIIYAVFAVPFANAGRIFPAFSAKKASGRSASVMRTVGWVAIGLVIAIIPTAIVVALLSYDEQFTALLDRIFSFSFDRVAEWIVDIIFTVPAALLIFGTVYGSWRRKKLCEAGEEHRVRAVRGGFFPKILLCAAVTPILAVYVLFFVSQWSYYVSAFTHVLPEGLTYAAYARGGFFELCWVSGINAVLLFLFQFLMRRREGERGIVPKLYSAVLSLFTLVLIATALSKMVLYIGSYGLTQKRVYASWLMIVFAVAFILVLVKQFVPRMRLALCILVVCLVLFGAIAIPDVDGMIADYNVDAYLDGELNDVDVFALRELGVSATPALLELWDALEAKDEAKEELTVREQNNMVLTRDALSHIYFTYMQDYPEHPMAFHGPTQRAKAALEAHPIKEQLKRPEVTDYYA